jgi:hypothetical protein
VPEGIIVDELGDKPDEIKAIYLTSKHRLGAKYPFPLAVSIFWNPQTIAALVDEPDDRMHHLEDRLETFLQTIEDYLEVDFLTGSQHSRDPLGIPGPDFDRE